MNEESDDVVNVEVLDTRGKLIMGRDILDRSTMIDLSQNGKGLYFVKVVRGSEVNVEKVIYK